MTDTRKQRSTALLKPGATVYSASRFTAAGAAFVLAVAMTRVLPSSELGQFAAAFVVASFVGIYFSSSVRRLVMYRSETADLSDLKIAAALGSLLAVALAGILCGLLFDASTAVLATLLAGLRGADGYAEIGQAAWCQRGAFATAGATLALRVASSTLVAVGFLALIPNPVPALGAALVVRVVAAAIETHIARRQQFVYPAPRTVARSFASGTWISVVSAMILLIEAAPTLGVAKFAGFDTAALLTPLGRVRFAIILIATTLGEIRYPEMAAAAARGRTPRRASTQVVLQFSAATLVIAPFVILGGPFIFGSKLEGQYDLIAWAIVSGATLGLSSIFALELTAQTRILPQILVYALAAAIATIGTWHFDWTLMGLLGSQSIACLLALGVFLLLGRTRDEASRHHTEVPAVDTPTATRQAV